MKRFLGVVFFLFCVTCCLFLLFDWCERSLILSSENSESAKINRIIKEVNVDEIPIFGSSRALGNYAPSVLSPHCFNYGLNGTGMPVLFFFLNKELKKNKQGPIIVNIDPWGGEDQLGNIRNYTILNDSDTDIQALLPVGERSFSRRVPGLRFFGRLCSDVAAWVNGRKNVTRRVDHGAELLLQSCDEAEWNRLVRQMPPYRFTLSEKAFSDWSALLASLPPSRFVILVVSPVTGEVSDSFVDKEELTIFLKHCAEFKNVYVFDFMKVEECLARKYWSDMTHMNESGALIFSKKLLDAMQHVPELEMFFD